MEKIGEILKGIATKVRNSKPAMAALISIMVIGAVVGGVIAFEHVSTTTVTAKAAKNVFTQTLSFNGTNAQSINPISVMGLDVTSSTVNYTISSMKDVNSNLTMSLSAGNLTPGKWVKFVVGITNDGSENLDLNTSAGMFYFNSVTTFANGTSGQNYVFNASSGAFQLTPAMLSISEFAPPETASGFNSSLYVMPYNDTWAFAFGSNGVQHIPEYLASGSTFDYSVYIGIGADASNSVLGSTLTLEFGIPLAIAQ